MNPGFNLTFQELYNLDGLKRLDQLFLEFLQVEDRHLHRTLLALRLQPDRVADREYAEFLLKISPLFDDFLSIFFSIEQEVQASRVQHKNFHLIYDCKRRFVQRMAIKKYPESGITEIEFAKATKLLQLFLGTVIITQEAFAFGVQEWQQDREKFKEELDVAARYAAYLVHNGSRSILFSIPQAVNKENLITAEKVAKCQHDMRVGFDYYDPEFTLDNALNHASYCIYCHPQNKDSCSKGLAEDKEGCPLRQKISEMNYVKAQGFNIAALAIIVIDNPLVAATGHRICNDCMKACIYQKQEPVNVPLIESSILESVLELPFGLEIYLLLTRWNPLNIYDPLPKPDSGYKVLVAGQGPAGISLAHYLLNEGHMVAAIDGLKIMPLPFNIMQPIKYWHEYKEKLSARLPQGFGGVAEYGITSRWDKNNLIIMRLILARRENFRLWGSVRLGSNLSLNQALELGFHHVALCTGAGAPKLFNAKNFLAKGVRTASDFLMTLQSGGAFLKDSLTNLTVRMPIAVIGGGLTAVDAAVEALNYYPVQVEKFIGNYEALTSKFDKEYVEAQWTLEDKKIAEEFISHALLFRKQTGNAGIRKTLQDLGGATIYYRGKLQQSPAYKLNHEEVIQAIAAGVRFAENMTLQAINTDEFGYAASITLQGATEGAVAAKTILIAIGTENSNFEVSSNARNFTSHFGDADPEFAGSVVKALASSKGGYKKITQQMRSLLPSETSHFFSWLDYLLSSYVEEVNILSEGIVEVIIHSPLAAKNFYPGQFFRLQNFAPGASELMKPIALTGAYIKGENSISLIVLETGASTNLCRSFRPGDFVSLMGPGGTATEIVKNQKIILIGGGLGNAVLFSIAQTLRENNCHVTYFAGYRNARDRFYAEKIENAADIVVWCCENEILSKNRLQDHSVQGNVIEAIRIISSMENNLNGAALASQPIGDADRIISIGSASMMHAVQQHKLELFGSKPKLICSINSPMQCMMKGICGQCLQGVNEEPGYIFTCICQDQSAEIIDFSNLQDRLAQNSLQEKLLRLQTRYLS